MSRYLIDTHVWLWMQAEPGRLRDETRELAVDMANELLLSAASAWEITIKYRIGKLPLPEPPVTYVPERMRRSGTMPLPIEPVHALRTCELPDHHSDPFDRLLIAQAQILRIPIVTVDNQIQAYDVDIVAA
ncbi:MAG TPA: type II toxin-antitoxin system VapC family toxin [Acidimicrobiales bacterium]|nr:type II toxin-antitoxin system VapC family toxin [Acidimicrobiales bacterium]